jgi:enoyl-[acyl-carrier protein] reductase II
MKNKITALFNIEYPIIQAGMVWCSGWELASAVSNAGGLGIIGAGSMYPSILEIHIDKCKAATDKPFAVNLPLLYPDIDKHIKIILEKKVPIVFTSAGSPKTWTKILKDAGIIVVHVVSSVKFALKSQDAGVDAIVAEGFEAGGHNGKDETTTLCLIPKVAAAITLPLIAAGGISSGRAMLAVMNLGAHGVQIGSRFVISKESSAHSNFKQKIIETDEGGTMLTLKELTPVRLIKNTFYQHIESAYERNASADELREILSHGRAKKGMFEGDLNDGELEIGQVASLIHEIKTAKEIIDEIIDEFHKTRNEQSSQNYLF